jgi:hypothetical protein
MDLSQLMEEQMAKLSDTQLIVLSKASARDDGVAVLPDHLRKAAAYKVSSSLVARKLMREIRSKPRMPVWRQNDQEHNISLLITKAGRTAIGVDEDVYRDARPKIDDNSRSAAVPTSGKERCPRAGSKQARVVTMLSSGHGITIDAVSNEMGWLPHTTRAVFTGLRKRGFCIARDSDGKSKSLYRIEMDGQASVRA